MRYRNPAACLLFSAALLLALPACLAKESAKEEMKEPGAEKAPTILERLEQEGNYTTLLAALKDTGVNKTLADKGTFTLFAPNDQAFEKVSALKVLLADKAKLAEVLRHHIVLGQKLDLTRLQNMQQVTPLEGPPLKIMNDGDAVRVNGAKIVQPDLLAQNGIVQGLDMVLMDDQEGKLPGVEAPVQGPQNP